MDICVLGFVRSAWGSPLRKLMNEDLGQVIH